MWSSHHICERPCPATARCFDELVILRAGVYNLGFIGVAPTGLDVLRWWQERLARDCIMRAEEGYHVDQKWIDLVPARCAVEINRSPALNLAYWNIHEFDLSVVDGVVHIADEPLAFFHFSGFDPERDDRLSSTRSIGHAAHHAIIRCSLSCAATYAQALQEERSDMAKVAYGYNQTPDGLLLDAPTRNAIRSPSRRNSCGAPLLCPTCSHPTAARRSTTGTSHRWSSRARPPGPSYSFRRATIATYGASISSAIIVIPAPPASPCGRCVHRWTQPASNGR